MPVSPQHLLNTASELLFRQVHPGHLDESGRVGTLAFKVGKEHVFQISVDRESKTTAAAATELHRAAGRKTAGAWGVGVGECNTAGVKAYDDPDDEKPAHAVIDKQPLGTSQRNRVATTLASYARERGCLFAAPPVAAAPACEPETAK